VGRVHRRADPRPAAAVLRLRVLLPLPALGPLPRTLNYSHYLFEAIPYACLSLGTLLDLNWDGPGFRRVLARLYLAIVVAMYFFFLPFLLALPIPTSWYYFEIRGWRPWTWFPTWV